MEEVSTKHSKTRRLHQLRVMDTEKTNQRFSVSDVRSMYYGHIVRDCPTKKKGRQLASTVDVDPKPHQRDEDIKDEAFFF
jgi:hypothetical protein